MGLTIQSLRSDYVMEVCVFVQQLCLTYQKNKGDAMGIHTSGRCQRRWTHESPGIL